MLLDFSTIERLDLETLGTRQSVAGEDIRDYSVKLGLASWYPYDDSKELLQIETFPAWTRLLWRARTLLGNRQTFAGETYNSADRKWYQWHQLPRDIGASPLAIAFPFVSTHNHFVLDRGGRVFKQTAPIVKLSGTSTEEDHLRLLGTLDSSTACFWLKQNCFSKGNGGIGGGIGDEAWEPRYEFAGNHP